MTPIIASAESDKPRELPEVDVHNAVCVYVEDLGKVPMTYQGVTEVKHRVYICWEIEQRMADGRRFHQGKEYTLSLWKQATLFKDINSWRGKSFTADELKHFDLDILKGKPCRLSIVHSEPKDGVTYANVASVLTAKGEPLVAEVDDVPEWIATRRQKYAAKLAAFFGGPEPEMDRPSTAVDEVPF